jgi:hypothetical protein
LYKLCVAFVCVAVHFGASRTFPLLFGSLRCFGSLGFLRGNLILGFPTGVHVTGSTQRATNQGGLIRRLAVLGKGFRGGQVQTRLRALHHLLCNFNGDFCSASGDTATGCTGQRTLCGLHQLLLGLGSCECGIIGDAQNALDDSLTKCECSTCAFEGRLPHCGSACACAVDAYGLALLLLLRGLAFDVGAENLRQ